MARLAANRKREREVQTAITADAALHAIGASYDWLQALAPVNAGRIWRDLCRGSPREPVLEYAPLGIDTDRLRRELFAIPIEDLGDPLLEALLREKQLEIERQLRMLSLRDTAGFLQASLDLFGDADAELVAHAERIVASPADPCGPGNSEPCVEAAELAAHAEAELAGYREKYPGFPVRVSIREDVTAGIMVSGPEVRISKHVQVKESRVEPLLHHEIGTHVLTYYNGLAQPIKQFSTGLAHYDALQEGLGVLAEIVTGGLSAARLRTLAARVIAVRHRVDGASFIETFRSLVAECGLQKRGGFLTALRAFRGGGLTKDVVYLRGLGGLLAYLAEGHAIEPLYLGKFALEELSAVNELRRRGVLAPPRALPRWLDGEGGHDRLERWRGTTLAGLYQRSSGEET